MPDTPAKQNCCAAMTQRVNFRCDMHPDPFDCSDSLVYYAGRFYDYGLIIHDGGSSVITIEYCPWFGKHLPDAKRDLWFDTIENLGPEDAPDAMLPPEYLTDEWYATMPVAK